MDTAVPFRTWAALLGAVYFLLCLGYFLLHRFFVFRPSRKIDRAPDAFDLDFEDCEFKAEDGTRLRGWWMRPSPGIPNTESEAPVILFLPGNKGTLSRFLPQFRELCNAGFAVLAFGYRGFGGSENTPPSERGVRLDVDGAWRHLVETRRVDPRRIIVFAQSLGCAFGTRLAARCNPSGLICEAGFRSLAAITARRVPWIPVALLTPKSYETGRHLEKVRCPVLVAHSVEDPAVPFEEALSLFRVARAPKTLVRLRGAHARGLEVMPSEFIERIKTFFLSRPPGP